MKIMPISVLIDICKAIEHDEKSKEKASEVSVPLNYAFTKKMSDVLMHVSDTEVRRWALNEIKGVDFDRSNAQQ